MPNDIHAGDAVEASRNPPQSHLSSPMHRWKQRLISRCQLRQILDCRLVSTMVGMAFLAASYLPMAERKRQSFLLLATRRLETKGLQKLGRRALQPWISSAEGSESWRKNQVGWTRYLGGGFGDVRKQSALTTSLVLKEPGPGGEKGVIYSSFEFNWMKIVANHDARKVLKDYYLVGASSWSPSDHAVLANLCGLSEDPVFIGVSNLSDMDQYRMFSPWIEPLPLMACDWIDPGAFQPVPHSQRTIDIVMVASTVYWKRHWLLFSALKRMRADLNVVLIGRIGKRVNADVLAEARAFGVKQDITFLNNLEIDEVTQHLCNARVSLALSKREGSCVAVTESMFADTPVGIMHDAHIGAKAHINEQTGRILRPGRISFMLEEMLERSGDFSPRSWAMNNISAQLSSDRLNHILREHSHKNGRPWTKDIAPMCWRYVPRYLNEKDEKEMLPGRIALRNNYGIEFEDFVSENHGRK